MLHEVPEPQVLVRHDGHLLLVLPDEVRDVAHRHGQQGPGGHGAETERGHRPQEDAAVPRHDRARHCGDDDVDAAWEQTLPGLGRGRERGDGVGEGVFHAEDAGEEVVEAVLGGEAVPVEEEAGFSDLRGQEVCRGGLGRRSLGGRLESGRFLCGRLIVDGFSLRRGKRQTR